MSEDPRIVLLQDKLAESKMHPAEQAALADDLQFAVAINGDQAPVMQGLKRMLISGVRRELAAQEREERHYAACPVASRITKDKDGSLVMPWEGRGQAGTLLTLNFREGFKATGGAAVIAAVVITLVGVAYGVSYWQSSTMMEEMKALIQAKQPAMSMEGDNHAKN